MSTDLLTLVEKYSHFPLRGEEDSNTEKNRDNKSTSSLLIVNKDDGHNSAKNNQRRGGRSSRSPWDQLVEVWGNLYAALELAKPVEATLRLDAVSFQQQQQQQHNGLGNSEADVMVFSESPFITCFAELTNRLSNNSGDCAVGEADAFPSPMGHEVLLQSCRDIVSFPEMLYSNYKRAAELQRFGNSSGSVVIPAVAPAAAASSSASLHSNPFYSESVFLSESRQYLERLCDALLLFSIVQPSAQDEDDSNSGGGGAFSSLYHVSDVVRNDAREYFIILLSSVIVKRGGLAVLLERLAAMQHEQRCRPFFYVSDSYYASGAHIASGLALVYAGISDASLKPRRRLRLTIARHDETSDAGGDASAPADTVDAVLTKKMSSEGVLLLLPLAKWNTRDANKGNGSNNNSSSICPVLLADGFKTAVLLILSLAHKSGGSSVRDRIIAWLMLSISATLANGGSYYFCDSNTNKGKGEDAPTEEGRDVVAGVEEAKASALALKVSETMQIMREALLHTLFTVFTTEVAVPRHLLRLVFHGIVFPLVENWQMNEDTPNDGEEEKKKEKEKALKGLPFYLMNPVMSAWGDRSVTLHAPLPVLSAMKDSVLYSLVIIQSLAQIKERAEAAKQEAEAKPKKDEKVKDSSARSLLGRFHWVSPVHNGVGHRLESTRSVDLRYEGQTVAAGYAYFYVKDAETVDTFMKENAFGGLLRTWLNEEEQEVESPVNGRNPNIASGGDYNSSAAAVAAGGVTAATAQGGDKQQQQTLLLRRAAAWTESFPVDPDEEYHFFLTRSQCDAQNEKVNAVSVGKSLVGRVTNLIEGKDKGGGSAVDEGESALVVNEEERGIKPFGLQQFAKDELDDGVVIVDSFRGSYNLLAGIGRAPNAQLHEIQRDLESGLRSLHKCLANLREHIQRVEAEAARTNNEKSEKSARTSSRLSLEQVAKLSAELTPMLSSLVSTLVTMRIHAPEEKTEALMLLRYQCLVQLIVFAPQLALYHLSEVIYGRKYSLYQRAEVVKAVGEAAVVLSAVPSGGGASSSGADGDRQESAPRKRLYPPIPEHESAAAHRTAPVSFSTIVGDGSRSHGGRAIAVSEGHNTRRWGSADLERIERRKRNPARTYVNYLGDVAPFFISALLAKVETASGSGSGEDHTLAHLTGYKFFQDNDAFTPSEVLRSLMLIFQGLRTSARHVAPGLCQAHMDFFIAAASQHPIAGVRRQAWVALGEVMRCWCGAPPYMTVSVTPSVHADDMGFQRAPTTTSARGTARRGRTTAGAFGAYAASASLLFSEDWITALQAVDAVAKRQLRAYPDDAPTVVLVMSGLQELLAEEREWGELRERAAKAGLVQEMD